MSMPTVFRTPGVMWGRGLLVLGGLLLAAASGYLLLALIGMLPANAHFRDAGASGIEIFVTANDIHTDLVLPTANRSFDWRTLLAAEDFRAPRPERAFVRLSWGDRRFFVETPSWEDIRLTTAAQAAFWRTEAVLHVEYSEEPARNHPAVRSIRLTKRQYEALVRAIRDCFRQGAQRPVAPIAGAHYHRGDAFYRARGAYHLLNTCNCWTGQMLRTAGVRVGRWTPFPQSVLWSLP